MPVSIVVPHSIRQKAHDRCNANAIKTVSGSDYGSPYGSIRGVMVQRRTRRLTLFGWLCVVLVVVRAHELGLCVVAYIMACLMALFGTVV